MSTRHISASAWLIMLATFGCGSNPAANEESTSNGATQSALQTQTITLQQVRGLPEKWQQVASNWSGVINARFTEPAKSILEGAQEIELFSLHPYQGCSPWRRTAGLDLIRVPLSRS